MKNILSRVLLVLIVVIVTGGYLVMDRYNRNPEQIVPFPYVFQNPAPPIQLDAPILIVGDRMGHYLGKFSATLAEVISVNLDKPIKVSSIAREGYALHRTLHELRSLKQWPQIVIYQGASEEFAENKFTLTEITKIKKNFDRYRDDRIETLLILYPWLSRIVYEPLELIPLGESPVSEELDEKQYVKRLETELLLFEQHLAELVNMSKDRGSLLVLTTTPLNLDERPRQICSFSSNVDVEAEVLELRELLKANNPKEAYNRSSELVKRYVGNAELLYFHGQIAKRLGKIDEAINSLLSVSAYDCRPWRATEIHNSIIRRVAKDHQVPLFDFARLVEKDFNVNTTFFDEIHPQNLYYEKGMRQLGIVIRRILKL